MRNAFTVTRWAGRSSSRPSFCPMRNSPPGIGTRSLGLIIYKGELQLVLIAVHTVQNHPHLVAYGEFAARALAHHLAHVLLISVLIAGQSVDGDQALDKQVGQFHEEA